MDDDITRAKEEARKQVEYLKWNRERHEWKRRFAIAAGADALSAHYRAPQEEIPIIELSKMIFPDPGDYDKHVFLSNYLKKRTEQTHRVFRDGKGNLIIAHHRAKRFIDEISADMNIKIPPMVEWWLHECNIEPPKSWLINQKERDGVEDSRAMDAGVTPESGCAFPAPETTGDSIHRRTREINRWLRETWEGECRPSGAKFFLILKKYKGVKGSPIEEWYGYGNDAGIRWRTSGGDTGHWKKKTIQTRVSEFKKSCQEE